MSSLIFLLFFSFICISFTASVEDPFLIDLSCSGTKTFSRNSTYFTNLTTLLSSLSSRNASYSTGFQYATAGESPDMITGLFLCRGDVSPEVCRNCVLFSINATLTGCPNVREAVSYYDECMLRYSDWNILSTLTFEQGVSLTNVNNISYKVVPFQNPVTLNLNHAAVEAANSHRKFFTFKTNWTAFQNLYGLVQCTPDLNRDDCLRCLQLCINTLPLYQTGARYLFPSCNTRYEIYPFYNETAITTPTLPQLQLPPHVVSSPLRPGKGGNSIVLVVAVVVPIILVILLSISGYCFLAKRAKKTCNTAPAYDGDITTPDSLQLDYRTIQTATNDFAERNKIGQGGFGEVYKGTFSNGTEVAVKRLSKTSEQGDTEFKNEVVVVAKLRHRNLVRLQGFCLEGEERILVYEYVRNKSLDYTIFDPAKKGQLDWTLRYKIIGGIARGILYLHQDSRLTVIHRDLKASNILLDVNMNPKIADFGMARILGMDQTREKTSKIVGTFGYMSPEYVMRGQFSTKSDVYSFGVLVLEIISGRRNSSFHETDVARDLVTYAWRLWSNGTPLDLVDPIIVGNCEKSEVVQCIHLGLLCVQEDPVKRPTLPTISVMLTSNTVTLPMPRQPGFFVQTTGNQLLHSNQSTTSASINAKSITDLYPR